MRPEESLHGVVTGGYMEFRYENGELYTGFIYNIEKKDFFNAIKNIED